MMFIESSYQGVHSVNALFSDSKITRLPLFSAKINRALDLVASFDKTDKKGIISFYLCKSSVKYFE